MKIKIITIVSALMIISLFSSCTKTETNMVVTETTKATKATTPVKITVIDSVDGEIEITPSEKYNISTLNKSCFSKNNNRITYNDGSTYSVAGIDVSSYCGEIDWNKVKNDGIEFAIIRIGGRGYGESGEIYIDQYALHNIEKAKNAGLDIGIYFFSQAVTVKEAKEEAQYVLDQLGKTKLELPIVYDFEFIEGDTARTDNISGKQMTDFAKAFSSVVEEAGYKAMIYGESHDFYQMYNLNELKNIPLWYAQYSDTPDFYYEYNIWQYSNKGTVEGINGSVDINIMFKNK